MNKGEKGLIDRLMIDRQMIIQIDNYTDRQMIIQIDDYTDR